MKRLIGGRAFVRMFLLVGGILLLFSCDLDEKDMRVDVVNHLGDPDYYENNGFGANEYYYYFYDNAEINLVYYFLKSAPGCGSSGNWYIAATYRSTQFSRELYIAPTLTHTPVTTSAPGVDIPITALIYDDGYVKDAVLCYRIAGAADSTEVVMNPSSADSSYTATIEANAVTTAGVQYYIKTYDGDNHASRLPKIRGYYTITVAAGVAKTVGEPQSSKAVVPNYKPVSQEKNHSPL